MDKIDLVQKIGNEVCDNCGPSRDCGLDYAECERIDNAIILVDEYLGQDEKGTTEKD